MLCDGWALGNENPSSPTPAVKGKRGRQSGDGGEWSEVVFPFDGTTDFTDSHRSVFLSINDRLSSVFSESSVVRLPGKISAGRQEGFSIGWDHVHAQRLLQVGGTAAVCDWIESKHARRGRGAGGLQVYRELDGSFFLRCTRDCSSISFGAGLTGNLPEPNNAVSRVVLTSDQLRVNVSITPNTQVLAFSGDYYFEMLLTPAAGYQLTLDTLTLGFASSWMYDPGPPVSGTPSARGFAIRTSADNFATVVDSYSALPNPTTAFETLSMNLSGIGPVSGPLTVRIYTYDSASSISNNLRFDDLAVNGTASLVPEPRMAGLMLMGLGWASCLGRSRKRRG
jgi:hypothetical protein